MLQRFTDITCRHAQELLSQRMDRPLGFWLRIRLQLHLRACALCARVGQQFDFIRQATRRIGG